MWCRPEPVVSTRNGGLMGIQQRWEPATESYAVVPQEIGEAAATYQRHREIEARQLAIMSGHNLVEEWTPEAHAAVLEARVHVRAAREARNAFRRQVREVVRALRAA